MTDTNKAAVYSDEEKRRTWTLLFSFTGKDDPIDFTVPDTADAELISQSISFTCGGEVTLTKVEDGTRIQHKGRRQALLDAM